MIVSPPVEQYREESYLPMKGMLSIWTCALLATFLAVAMAKPTPAKHAPNFTGPDVLTVSDIPYPATTVDAGVVTLAVNLDSAGNVLNIQTLRDLPSVTGQTIIALQGWTYKPASLDGKNIPSTLIVNVVFDPAFLQVNNIPLGAPASFQPPDPKTKFSPIQLFGANFPSYPANGSGQGAVVLDATIDATNKISQVSVLRDLPTLTAAAVSALKTWTFSSASYSNSSIASKVVVAMVFRSPKAALP
jgi:hypothetical protein